ncbi:MAG TPA: sodium:proton antiporter [Candidatus Sulfotelmatobacter sp.]|nr:sodium:proton antiporter [Candidatus Sulfotelmatobacter sp.]
MPPFWTVLPFVLMLLSIAVVPLAWPHWWESNTHKGYVSLGLGGFVLVYLLAAAPQGAGERVFVTLLDYVAFIALLGSLFVVSGGIYIKGSLAGTPRVNGLVLLVGAILASVMGTTGASVLLVRPMIRANAWRQKQAHVMIFLTFLVANIGGLLTPLGDPPLYLGFLKGVPFQWTLRLLPQWAFTVGLVLIIFCILDGMYYRTDLRAGYRPARDTKEPLGIEGAVNVFWLALIVTTIFGSGILATSHVVREMEKQAPLLTEVVLKLGQAAAMLAVAWCSTRTTAARVREKNAFNYAPILEVAVLFIGIFLTMIPALWILDELGKTGHLALTQPWEFFWASGGLSSFLDNAPTYLTFSAAASGLHHQFIGQGGTPVATDPNNLALLLESTGRLIRNGVPVELGAGAQFLKAIACGSVCMGANSYIGNGPNFMVKTIAEQNGVRMPSFFGYMGYSIAFLIPVFVLVTIVFFR